ncbi:ankyrin repeat domain-containing protein [Microseira sp. BLCC-F43]|uniref:ankyrin repeat domain-containing protein n=1 Tax=Microseira sp. BLCC-F43 TaxID=3153602 RepID=UPI0035B6FFDC
MRCVILIVGGLGLQVQDRSDRGLADILNPIGYNPTTPQTRGSSMEQLHQTQDIIAQRYRIIDTLGQGGSGTTYHAEDLQTGQRVALKALSLHRMNDWKMIELFEREAKVLAQLNHPAIPRYLEYFHVDTPSDRSFYIAQQLAEGKSLAALVQAGWHATEAEVRRIAEQILEILVYLHQQTPPVIHRDIKPQNIILRSPQPPEPRGASEPPLLRGAWGDLFLVDFGAVQDTYYSTFMRGRTVVGTFGYMAPEQFRGQAVPVTDLYGLGATLLFLLTHRSPAELPTDGLKLNFRSRLQISEDFAAWLEKMLDPDVEDRFASAKVALAVLRGEKKIAKVHSTRGEWGAIASLGMATIATMFVLNSYRWAILNRLGFEPTGTICYDANEIRNYINQGGNPNSLKDPTSLLGCAAAFNNKELALLLIAKGADVNALNQWSQTPLHWAAQNNSKDVAQLLIVKGANVNAKEQSGDTPLHYAAFYNSKDVAQLLIAKGANVNALNQAGDTPLHQVVLYNQRTDAALLLIAKGADVNALNQAGDTPLHWAASYNKKDVALLLIAKGADVNALNQSGDTPLHWAAKGVDVNAKNQSGEIPLPSAVWGNGKDIAQLLITKGADVNAKNQSGETPLHSAAWSNRTDVALLLIAKGADVNALNQSGQTPLHIPAWNNSKDVALLLKRYGAKE